jgi:hypothetical protein
MFGVFMMLHLLSILLLHGETVASKVPKIEVTSVDGLFAAARWRKPCVIGQSQM